MSGQGYHLAIAEAQAEALLNTRGESAVLDAVDELLGGSGEVHGGYQDWDVLLLCLTGGTYDPRGGTYPLNQCFFGGRLLVSEWSIVNLVMPDVVREIAASLAALSGEWF